VETFVHCKNNPQLTMISLSIDTSGLLLDQLSVIEKFLHHSAHRCDCFKQARLPERKNKTVFNGSRRRPAYSERTECTTVKRRSFIVGADHALDFGGAIPCAQPFS